MVITDLSPAWTLALPPSHGRSPGMHVSTILRAIAVEHRLLDPDNPDGTNSFNETKMWLGLAFEDKIAQHWSGLSYHQGELHKDGIAGSPDAIDTRAHIIHEFKLTWYSQHRPIESFWLYWAQLKSYCVMKGWNSAVLHVFFVNGNYRPSTPLYKVYRVTFSDSELDEHWEMVLKKKEQLLTQGGVLHGTS